jgi:hypothetical protein
MTRRLSTGTYCISKLVVSADVTQGNFTTLTAATAAASSGDIIYIAEGVYTEDFTAKPGVLYCGLDSGTFITSIGPSTSINPVTIKGKVTMSSAGQYLFADLAIITNGDFCLVGSAAGQINVELSRCVVHAVDHAAISFTSASASSTFYLAYCNVAVLADGNAFYSMTSPGDMVFSFCTSGQRVTSTYSSNSAGFVETFWSEILFPMQTTGTGFMSIFYTDYDANVGMNFTGTGGGGIAESSVGAQGGFTFNVGAGVTIKFYNSNSAAVVGTPFKGNGTVYYALCTSVVGSLTFSGTLTTIALPTI